MLFQNLPWRSKIALFCFIYAKVMGGIGTLLSYPLPTRFVGHTIFISAFVAIFTSITFCIWQMLKDNKRWLEEDSQSVDPIISEIKKLEEKLELLKAKRAIN